MKNFLALYKPYMNRPILNKAITKFVVALVILLAWDRLFNQNNAFLVVRDGCLVPALVFLAAAWFSYLKLDGMSLNLGLERRRKQPKRRSFNKGMMDYVETDVVTYEELTPEERTACRFASNLLPGVLFLIASLGAMLFV